MSRPTSLMTATELDPRWAAVVARDRGVDGTFVYSVATTGVYCRPSCASRRANPRNVAFHAGPAEAERAGFRPCKRCRPTGPRLDQVHAATIAALCRTIDAAETPPRLAALARRAGLSAYHFHRVFKAVTGVTPHAYVAAARARRVQAELARPGKTVTAALYDAGFNSAGRFYEATGGVLGMTPSEFRNGGERQTIRFAVGECSLGSVLVARTGKGICAILLGDDPDALVRDLQDRFPRAELVGDDETFAATIARVVGLVDAPGRGLDLPLDIQGSVFQRRVWQALRQIPAGSTASYAEVARRIGAPRAVRAVARACAANPLAVAIPCHRVVRTNGDLSGYRWGIERKRTLLRREGAA